MINPNGDEFTEDDPLAQSRTDESLVRTEGRLRNTAQKVSDAAGETWEHTKERAGIARAQTEVFLRENPVPTILGALAVGLAIGLAIRYASSSEKEEIKLKTPIGNLGFLSLPFLWPLFRSARERYEESAEALKDGVGRLRKIDIDRYAKPIRKRWKAWTD